jgi:hypothetical protein
VIRRFQCAVGRHIVESRFVINGAFAFSDCRYCRDDLISCDLRRWTEVPRGFRVVWAAAPRRLALPSARPPELQGLLPAPMRAREPDVAAA